MRADASAYVLVMRETILSLPQCSQRSPDCTTPNMVSVAEHNFGHIEGARAAVRIVKQTTVNVIVVIVFDVDWAHICTLARA